MYEFILSEEWWMETIIAALITSGITLLGTIISGILAYNFKLKIMMRNLEDLIKKNEEIYRGLSGEHKELSGGHKELSGEHRKLLDKQIEITCSLSGMEPSIRGILEDTRKISLIQDRQEEAGKHMPNEVELLNNVQAVFKNRQDEIEALRESLNLQVESLNKEIESLNKENKDLKKRIKMLEKQSERDRMLEQMARKHYREMDEPEL